jgi:hypothetical protein
MSIPGRGKWAWDLYRLEPSLWDIMFHGDPYQHIEDPRQVLNAEPEEPPQLGVVPAPYIDPNVVDANADAVRGRVLHYLEVYDLVYGR